MATSLAVQSFEGTNFGAEGTPRADEDTLVLGVWRHDESEPVAILAEFSPGDVEFVGDIRRGRSVVVEVESLRDRQIVRVRGSWGPGFPTEGAQDRDRDGVPDTAGNCLETSNPGQADRDRDRIGDACDPDFDQDGVVNKEDLEIFALNFGRTDCALAACPGDLDEDGVVDGVDLWISTPAAGGSGCREEAG